MSEKAKAGHACQNLPRFHPPSEFHAIREKWMKWSTFRPWNDDKTKKSLPQMIIICLRPSLSLRAAALQLIPLELRDWRMRAGGKDLQHGRPEQPPAFGQPPRAQAASAHGPVLRQSIRQE